MTETTYQKDIVNKKMFITREFLGSLEDVWEAWTNPEILDQWWAPLPWKARTKSMNFTNGGSWLYAMVGPNGEQHWAKATYNKIVPMKSVEVIDAFCDENGVENDFPKMHWNTTFKRSEHGTLVEIEITFTSEEALQTIINMGFQEGFSAAHENLDKYLQSVPRAK
jgi:uncharacterized protein YndB with AHSA1/START domain